MNCVRNELHVWVRESWVEDMKLKEWEEEEVKKIHFLEIHFHLKVWMNWIVVKININIDFTLFGAEEVRELKNNK
jgi:hypothetical protein